MPGRGSSAAGPFAVMRGPAKRCGTRVKTWAERKLGLRCYDYFEGEARSHFGQLDRSRANADKVLLLASIWSLDPSSIDDSALTDAVGIAGDLSRARPR